LFLKLGNENVDRLVGAPLHHCSRVGIFVHVSRERLHGKYGGRLESKIHGAIHFKARSQGMNTDRARAIAAFETLGHVSATTAHT
jgi:hypothetical protein